jgi:nucleotide-binding universal stress UspA family protein
MTSIKTIVTCLDLTNTDDKIIQYTSFLCEILEIEHVTFLHVNNRFEIPKEITDQYPNLVEDFTSKLKVEMEEKVKGQFTCGSVIPEVVAVDGNAVEEILKMAKKVRTDLILMGRKPCHEASGTIPAEISRLSKSSVLIVPNTSPAKIDTIQLTLDFSKYSTLAMEVALLFTEKTNAKITGQHVYHVPVGYSSTGKTYAEFSEIMLGHAKRDYQRFIKNIELKGRQMDIVFTLDSDTKPTDRIINLAYENRPDLLVIGSRGRTKAAAVLLGSIAKKLIQNLVDVPLLIVKDRKEGMSFLEALKQL